MEETYSAKELRREYDERTAWQEGLYGDSFLWEPIEVKAPKRA